ncbi:Fc.00g063560.m01.CDS01 [Cosmosporella sp. VM-42]
MLLPTLIGAVGLLSTAVEAAPKGSDFSSKVQSTTTAATHGGGFQAPEAFTPQAAPRPRENIAVDLPFLEPRNMLNATANSTATSPVTTRTETVLPIGTSTTDADYTTECPTGSVIVSTKTVDVTVYISAGVSFTVTEPCDDVTSSGHSSGTITHGSETVQSEGPCTTDGCHYGKPSYGHPSETTSTVSEHHCSHPGHCDEETTDPYNKPTYPFPSGSTTLTRNQTIQTYTHPGHTHTSTEPCDDDLTSTIVTTISGNHTTQTQTTIITYSDPASTEPCDDETSSTLTSMTTIPRNQTMQSYTNPGHTVTTSEPCDDEATSSSALKTTKTGSETIQTYTRPGHTTTSEPCDDDLTSTLSSVTTVSANQTIQTYTNPRHTATTSEPCDDETTTGMESTSISIPTTIRTSIPPFANTSVPLTSRSFTTTTILTEPCDETTTSRSFTVTPFLSTTTTPTFATETCVIDTSMTPVTTATLTTATTPPQYTQPSQTVCEYNYEPGTPDRDSEHCGVPGEPVGTYFIAEFIEDRPGVVVSLEGCYQFCDSVMDSTRGCQAYRFYHNNLGAPRCALYGMPVSWDVRELDPNQPNRWYDLTCGSPTAEAWHEDMPASHADAGIQIGIDI